MNETNRPDAVFTFERPIPAPRESVYTALISPCHLPRWRSGLREVIPRRPVMLLHALHKEYYDRELLGRPWAIIQPLELLSPRRVAFRRQLLQLAARISYDLDEAEGGTLLRVHGRADLNPALRAEQRGEMVRRLEQFEIDGVEDLRRHLAAQALPVPVA
jgi:hypothetical protein